MAYRPVRDDHVGPVKGSEEYSIRVPLTREEFKIIEEVAEHLRVSKASLLRDLAGWASSQVSYPSGETTLVLSLHEGRKRFPARVKG